MEYSPKQINFLDVLITKKEMKIGDSEFRLTNRGFKSEIIQREIQKANFIDRRGPLKKCSKHQKGSIALVLTFHPALHIVLDVLKRMNQRIQNSPLLAAVLPKPQTAALLNPNIILDELVR